MALFLGGGSALLCTCGYSPKFLLLHDSSFHLVSHSTSVFGALRPCAGCWKHIGDFNQNLDPWMKYAYELGEGFQYAEL